MGLDATPSMNLGLILGALVAIILVFSFWIKRSLSEKFDSSEGYCGSCGCENYMIGIPQGYRVPESYDRSPLESFGGGPVISQNLANVRL